MKCGQKFVVIVRLECDNMSTVLTRCSELCAHDGVIICLLADTKRRGECGGRGEVDASVVCEWWGEEAIEEFVETSMGETKLDDVVAMIWIGAERSGGGGEWSCGDIILIIMIITAIITLSGNYHDVWHVSTGVIR